MLLTQATLYKTFGYFNLDGYKPGAVHALLRMEQRSSRDLNRMSEKTEIIMGRIHIQSNRSACNQAGVKPICQLCCSDKEILEHFVLYCSALEYTRNPVISDISYEVDSLLNKPYFSENTNLLPPKPKSTFRHLKQGIQNFHRKYVLVPADKAANNVVVV